MFESARPSDISSVTDALTTTPDWVIPELPQAYGEIATKMAALRDEAQKYEKMAAVLWQTGRPLADGVAAIFSHLQYEVAPSDDASSYRMRVNLGGDRFLIVQVAGASEAIDRKSPAITELLRVLQEEASEKDRLVLALNSWRDLPVDARKKEHITPEALKLIQRVGANVVTTATLFGIWKYSLTNVEAARKSVMNLYSLDGGFFK